MRKVSPLVGFRAKNMIFSLYLTLTLFGCLAGITTVLFGFGGGFVIVPLLYRALLTTYGAGSRTGMAAMHIAVATSTCVMIVSSAMATRRHRLKGNIVWSRVWPLAGYIAAGAVAGAALAVTADGALARWLFVAYLAVTIVDCLLRRGFISQETDAPQRRISSMKTALSGVAIGVIATFLGVGGSVMTVPMMRRQGLSMAYATAMANPLSLPVALAGTLTYMVMAWRNAGLPGGWYLGYVDIPAFAVLTLGSWLGSQLATPLVGRIPDRLHAKVYLGLLAIVLVSMAI